MGLTVGAPNIQYHIPNNQKVTVTLNHPEIPSGYRVVCVFLNQDKKSQRGRYGLWSSEGCRVKMLYHTSTQCECDHLTNFAILVDFYGSEHHFDTHGAKLGILSWICCVLSTLSLILTILVFVPIESLRSRRNTLTCNVAVCLLVMNILVMTGLERRPSDDPLICKIMSGALQFFVLSAVFWMLLEGILLYRMVILVYETKRMPLPVFYAIGYGIPLFIVLLTSSINPNEIIREKFCWPSMNKGQLWGVVGPIITVLVVNFVIFCMTIKASYNIDKQSADGVKWKNVLKRLKGFLSLMCLLGFNWGLTWLSGFLDENSRVFASYLFVLSNGLQGVFLFISQVLSNENVRCKLLKIFKEKKERFSSQRSSWNSFIPFIKSMKNVKSRESSVICQQTKEPETAVNRASTPSDVEIIRMRLEIVAPEDVHNRHPFGINYE